MITGRDILCSRETSVIRRDHVGVSRYEEAPEGIRSWTMTSMQSGGFGSFEADQTPFEQRTSVLAIVALILGVPPLMCIPGFGLIALGLGVAALVVIGNSKERLVGKGLAAAGIVTGLLGTLIWLGLGIGANFAAAQFAKGVVQPADQTMRAIEDGHWQQARDLMVTTSAEKITDADFEAFRTAYQSELGGYKSAPQGLWAYLKQLSEIGPAGNSMQSGGNMIPMPMSFEKERAVVVWQITNARPANTGQPIPQMFTNIRVHSSSKTYTLYDPENRPIPGDGSAKPDANAKPDADAKSIPDTKPPSDAKPAATDKPAINPPAPK